jgi:hypothetical protein
MCILGNAPASLADSSINLGRDVYPPRRIESSDRPLLRLIVERSQTHAAKGGARKFENVVVDDGTTTHHFLGDQSTAEFNPFVIVRKSFVQLSMMNSPMTHQEIEVMRRS